MSQIEEFKKRVHEMRDEKAIPHLQQYAPVWIVSEKLVPEDSSVIFNVLFQHNRYGWVSRRYKYDGFNNVLYQKGQNTVGEDDALDVVSEQEPYIEASISDVPNAYGG